MQTGDPGVKILCIILLITRVLFSFQSLFLTSAMKYIFTLKLYAITTLSFLC